MQDYIVYMVIGAFVIFMLYPKISIQLNRKIKNITAEEAYQLMKANKDLVIIDVRSRSEYESGHINGSKLIPVGEIASRVAELKKYKGSQVLVHCASGGRSPAAVRVLLKNGFSDLYHLKRGLSEWKYGLKK